MDTIEKHGHTFPESEWPFSDPTNTVAISTVRVFQDSYPILRVSHDLDGDWQVLCDTTVDTAHAIIVCLGCAFQKDNTIGQVADLPRGWTAYRDFVGGLWTREQKPDEEECDDAGQPTQH
jgi:hypothetical protein